MLSRLMLDNWEKIQGRSLSTVENLENAANTAFSGASSRGAVCEVGPPVHNSQDDAGDEPMRRPTKLKKVPRVVAFPYLPPRLPGSLLIRSRESRVVSVILVLRRGFVCAR